MKFFKDTIQFFRREPKWAFVLAAVLILFAVIHIRGERAEKKNRSHAALQQFDQMENRFKNKIKAEGGLEKYLKDKPSLFWLSQILSILLLVTFMLGLMLDYGWLTKPRWRSGIQASTGPPEATWGTSAILKTILLFIVGSIGISLLLGAVKTFLFPHWDTNFLILFHTTLSDFLCIGLVIYFVQRSGVSWRDLGFKSAEAKDFWLGVAGYMAIIPLFALALTLLILMSQLFSFEPSPHPLVEVFLEEEKSPGMIGYSIFLACVVGPFLEEIFFRGFCYPALKKRWGRNWGLLLSSAFFSAIHNNLFAFIPVFILGLSLGYLYEKRGTLIPSITLHILHNSIFILYFFLAKDLIKGLS